MAYVFRRPSGRYWLRPKLRVKGAGTTVALSAATLAAVRVKPASTFKLSLYATTRAQVTIGKTPATSLRQIATRTIVPNYYNTSTAIMSRRGYIARVALTTFQIVVPNWYVNPGVGEGTPSASSTVTASIEYPLGTFTQILFSGSASGTVPAGGSLISDSISVSVPQGVTFYVRMYCTNSSGNVLYYSGAYNVAASAFGDLAHYGTSGITDQTLGGTISQTNPETTNGPSAIIAQSSLPAIAIIGDSRAAGYADTPDTTGDVGDVARSIGPTFPYISIAAPGDSLVAYNASHVNRAALLAYCTHAVNELGINDVSPGNLTAAAILAAQQTLYGSVGLPIWQTTLEPVSTSTDGWATTGNQTTWAHNGPRVTVNDAIRAGVAQVSGYFEVANVVETAQDSGIWDAPGYTADGIHETQAGYIAIVTAGAINPAVFGSGTVVGVAGLTLVGALFQRLLAAVTSRMLPQGALPLTAATHATIQQKAVAVNSIFLLAKTLAAAQVKSTARQALALAGRSGAQVFARGATGGQTELLIGRVESKVQIKAQATGTVPLAAIGMAANVARPAAAGVTALLGRTIASLRAIPVPTVTTTLVGIVGKTLVAVQVRAGMVGAVGLSAKTQATNWLRAASPTSILLIGTLFVAATAKAGFGGALALTGKAKMMSQQGGTLPGKVGLFVTTQVSVFGKTLATNKLALVTQQLAAAFGRHGSSGAVNLQAHTRVAVQASIKMLPGFFLQARATIQTKVLPGIAFTANLTGRGAAQVAARSSTVGTMVLRARNTIQTAIASFFSGGPQPTPTPNYIAYGIARDRVVYQESNVLSQVNTLYPPIDANVEDEWVYFDFSGLVRVSSGTTIVSVVSVSCVVSSGVDPTPNVRLIGIPSIQASPVTGGANLAVAQLVGGMVGGTTYLLQCVCLMTDGQRLSLRTHLPCDTPS